MRVFRDYSWTSPVKILLVFCTVLATITALTNGILAGVVFKDGLLGYPKNPFYSLYALSGGLMHMIMAFHVITSSFFFLQKVYATRGFALKNFLYDWIIEQDGFRLLFMVACKAFVVYCCISIILIGQNTLTSLVFRKRLILLIRF
jgi:hypothetical protein